MNCPNCQTDNPTGSKFCMRCGTALSQIPTPEVVPVVPEEQPFQAREIPIEIPKEEEGLQEGASIAFQQATVPPAEAPQAVPSAASEWTSVPQPVNAPAQPVMTKPVEAFSGFSPETKAEFTGYPPQSSQPVSPPVGQYPPQPGPYPPQQGQYTPQQTQYTAPQSYPPQTQPYYAQQYAYPPQPQQAKPPKKPVNKKLLITLGALFALLIIAVILLLVVFRPMITKSIRQANGPEPTPITSGLVNSRPETLEPGPLPTDEPIPTEEPVPTDAPVPTPTEEPAPIFVGSSQSITVNNADQLQDIQQLGSGRVRNIALSPDGKFLAIAKYTGLTVYNLQLGEVHKNLNIDEMINDVVFLPNGDLLAGTEYGIDHYSAGDFRFKQNYDMEELGYAFAFSAEGEILLSESYTSVLVYKVDGNELSNSNEILADEYFSTFDISPDGTKMVTGNSDGVVKVWEVETGNLLQEDSTHSDYINQIVWSPDGSKFATASDDETVIIWNADGTQYKTLDGFENYVYSVRFSPDNTQLVIGYKSAKAEIWDIASASSVKTFEGGYDRFVNFAFDPTGEKLIGLNRDSSIYYWDLLSNSSGERIGHYAKYIESAAISPSGDKIFYLDNNGFSLMANANGDALWSSTPSFDEQMMAPAFSSDGSLLIGGTFGGYVYILDAESGAELSYFEAHDDWIRKLVVSPDGKTFATASDDHTVKLWDLNSHNLVATLTGHEDYVRALAFSPDGSYLASAGDDQMVILWDPRTGEQLYKMEGHEDYVFSLAFSPNGNLLASGGYDDYIILWDPKIGKQVQKTETNYNTAYDIAFSADSQSFFVPASHSIEQYGVEDGSLITDIGDFPSNAHGVWMSADGKTMITSGADGLVRIFRIP